MHSPSYCTFSKSWPTVRDNQDCIVNSSDLFTLYNSYVAIQSLINSHDDEETLPAIATIKLTCIIAT